MKKWFTSDWHLGEDRIGINGKPNLFDRPFDSIEGQNIEIYRNFAFGGFVDGDELWHLGDVVYDWQENEHDPYVTAEWVLENFRMRFPNSKFNLVVGNYDEDKLDRLEKYFHEIHSPSSFVDIDDCLIYLNHYPVDCRDELSYPDSPYNFAITGHIHGLWKVQKGMINVGVDAWHFKPVSEDEILFCWNAMQKFYDDNVFPFKNT